MSRIIELFITTRESSKGSGIWAICVGLIYYADTQYYLNHKI